MQKLHLALVALLAIAIVVPSVAFAETKGSTDADLQKAAADAISGVIIQGGAGAGMGFVLSFIRVMGKNLNAATGNGKPEPLVIYKLLLTVGTGTLVGIALNMAGLDTTNATGWDFFVTFIVSQLIFPIFGNRKWNK